MTPSLMLACGWAIAAAITALLPHRLHRAAACALIAGGIPILGWVTYQNGPVWGLLVLGAGASILCWPVLLPVRRMRERTGWQEPAE